MIYGGEIVKRGRWALKKWNSGFGGMINYESALCCGEIMINDVRPEARMLDFNLISRPKNEIILQFWILDRSVSTIFPPISLIHFISDADAKQTLKAFQFDFVLN